MRREITPGLACMLFVSHSVQKMCLFSVYLPNMSRKGMVPNQKCFANPAVLSFSSQGKSGGSVQIVWKKCTNKFSKWYIDTHIDRRLSMSSDVSPASEDCACATTELSVQERRQLASHLQNAVLSSMSQQDPNQNFLTFLQPVPRPNLSVFRSLERIRQFASGLPPRWGPGRRG